MKTAVYITKNKVFYLDKEHPWDGKSLVDVFTGIRNEKIKNLRIVLGNDLCTVTSFDYKEGDGREEIWHVVQGLVPYSVSVSGFDYCLRNTKEGKRSVQVVVADAKLVELVSKAVYESGLELEMMTAVGVLLAEKVEKGLDFCLVKWTGEENLTVLVKEGLAVMIFGSGDEEKVLKYLENKFALVGEIKELLLTKNDFNFSSEVFKESTWGDDNKILNLPILKKSEIIEDEVSHEKESSGDDDNEVLPKRNKVSKMTVILIIVLFFALGLMYFVYDRVLGRDSDVKTSKTVSGEIVPTAVPTLEAIKVEIDLSKIKVKVANGGEIAGEAARVKSLLVDGGFELVEVGNTPKTKVTEIKKKPSVDDAVVIKIRDLVSSYKVDTVGILTLEDEYDLVIVLGGENRD